MFSFYWRTQVCSPPIVHSLDHRLECWCRIVELQMQILRPTPLNLRHADNQIRL